MSGHSCLGAHYLLQTAEVEDWRLLKTRRRSGEAPLDALPLAELVFILSPVPGNAPANAGPSSQPCFLWGKKTHKNIVFCFPPLFSQKILVHMTKKYASKYQVCKENEHQLPRGPRGKPLPVPPSRPRMNDRWRENGCSLDVRFMDVLGTVVR